MDVRPRKSFRGEHAFSDLPGQHCFAMPVGRFATWYGTRAFWCSAPRLAAVISSSGKPVSAKQNLFLPRPRGFSFFCQLLGFALFLLPLPLRAESLEDAAHELAMKVCLAAHKQPVKVAWQESPESPVYLTDVRKKIFLDQISACGMAPAENSEAPVLTVTMQVTASRALLIANWTDSQGGRQTYMVGISRASLFAAHETPPAPQLQRELLWQQEKPIQSAMEWVDPSSQEHFLLVLSSGLFLRFHSENGAWREMDSTELPAVRRSSRSGDGMFFYPYPGRPLGILLDGKICDLKLDERVSFTCSGINLEAKASQISPACEERSRYLATGTGDYTQTDRIILRGPVANQAARPPNDGDASSIEVPGPVLGISVAENAKAAFAVVKNLSTGNYEVYRITAVCGN
jgi:hypothetical protein